jgi:hypothetical protein
LRLLGVATEVFRGRLRTYAERMASWRVGDRARGWASVWALHPPTPVDRTRIVCAGQIQMAPHPRRGLFSLKSSSREGVTTGKTVNSGAASRRSTKTRARKLSVPDPRGGCAGLPVAPGRTNPRMGTQTRPHRVGESPGRTGPVWVERRGPQRDHHRLGHRHRADSGTGHPGRVPAVAAAAPRPGVLTHPPRPRTP